MPITMGIVVRNILSWVICPCHNGEKTLCYASGEMGLWSCIPMKHIHINKKVKGKKNKRWWMTLKSIPSPGYAAGIIFPWGPSAVPFRGSSSNETCLVESAPGSEWDVDVLDWIVQEPVCISALVMGLILCRQSPVRSQHCPPVSYPHHTVLCNKSWGQYESNVPTYLPRINRVWVGYINRWEENATVCSEGGHSLQIVGV